MTEWQPNREAVTVENRRSHERALPCVGKRPRTSLDAIAAGLEYLQIHHRLWSCSTTQGSDFWLAACILAGLKDIPENYLPDFLREKLDGALDCLFRAVEDSRFCAVTDDGELIARAMLLFRRSGRELPEHALQALKRCRRGDGGFARRAAEPASSPELTVTMVQVLGTIDCEVEEYLSARLQVEAGQSCSWLALCAGILDWEKGLAPLPLLNQACRLLAVARPENAFEHALLLRCLVRLRLQRAWLAAADLRQAQLEDGSWPGPSLPAKVGPAGHGLDMRSLVPTVTAISALALCESQPGLYFGSDLPRARRLYES